MSLISTAPSWQDGDAELREELEYLDAESELELGPNDISGIEGDVILDDRLVEGEAALGIGMEDSVVSELVEEAAENALPNSPAAKSGDEPDPAKLILTQSEYQFDPISKSFPLATDIAPQPMDASSLKFEENQYNDEEHEPQQNEEMAEEGSVEEQNDDYAEDGTLPSLLLQWGEELYSIFSFDPAFDQLSQDSNGLLFASDPELFYSPLDQFLAALKDEFWPPEHRSVREVAIEFVGLDAEVGEDSQDARMSTLEDVWKLYVALQAAHKIDVKGPLRLVLKDRGRFLVQMQEWENILTQGNPSVPGDGEDQLSTVDKEGGGNDDPEEESFDAKYDDYNGEGIEASADGNDSVSDSNSSDVDVAKLALNTQPGDKDLTEGNLRSLPVRRESYAEPDDAELIAYEDTVEDDVESNNDPTTGSSDSEGTIKRKVEHDDNDIDGDQGKRPRTQ